MAKVKYIKGIFFGETRDYMVSFPENVTFKSFKAAYECHGGNLEKEFERLTGKKAPDGSSNTTIEKPGETGFSGSGKKSDKKP